jgi:hypothetical protein
MLNAEEKLNEFIGLIKWASYRYSQSSGSAFNYDDFMGEGQLILAKCLKVWEKRGYRVAKNERMGCLISKNEKRVRAILYAEARLEKEFAKYFKTALMNKFNGICSHRDLFAKKRVHTSVSLDDEDFQMPLSDHERINFSGFEDVFYKELIEHVYTTLQDEIEKKIFMLLADPPEGLCKLAIYRNRRKMKSTHITKKTRNGVNVVRPTTGLILEYLKEQEGHNLTRGIYYLHLRNIKKAVREAITK